MWAKFEVVSARTIDCKKKYVVYSIKIQKNGNDNDPQVVFLDRRYTDFLQLYTSLCQEYPSLTSEISFPKKVLIGNFSAELIKTRLLGLENFLKVISENYRVLNSANLKTFLTGHEEKLAIKFLKANNYSMAKPLLEKNFKILNKIYTERHPAVIVALCRLAACCTADPSALEDAGKYAELALRRFDGVSDVDLLYHYVPLLQMCAHLWGILGKDKEFLELKLSTLKRLGHRVDGCPSLMDSMLNVK